MAFFSDVAILQRRFWVAVVLLVLVVTPIGDLDWGPGHETEATVFRAASLLLAILLTLWWGLVLLTRRPYGVRVLPDRVEVVRPFRKPLAIATPRDWVAHAVKGNLLDDDLVLTIRRGGRRGHRLVGMRKEVIADCLALLRDRGLLAIPKPEAVKQ